MRSSPFQKTALAFAMVAGSNAPAAQLNDTGVRYCRIQGEVRQQCLATGQDAEFGRDVTSPADSNGKAGFSFVKVCNNGQDAGTGSCPADPELGSGASKWGCTKDKVTGLTWELKFDAAGPHNAAAQFTNLAADAPGHGGPTDAQGFVNQINATGLCGAADWRLPNVHEMLSIVLYGRKYPGPAIDRAYFRKPESGDGYAEWTSERYAGDPAQAWLVWFDDGGAFNVASDEKHYVRLVRNSK
ncbi:MAG TPA: DUF1566 domain-containing protein [Ideonella sp.]|uniref:Lcl C-terminal domain-containing protein n=1 Tax=Ideonella sp. TaxID=1929293 RepID=UPI002CCF891E|nr:DUF1566 domain-containing protein [Ideonella sp.]HSI51408.1 DUF1566 domain-containing protein [Ideonella sp.]